MTRPRFDDHGTEFSDWLRDQKQIESAKGFLATNLDFVWINYKTKKWIFIEEKRHMSKIKKWQGSIFRSIHELACHCSNYRGFVFLQFEKTSPQDGAAYWNHLQNDKWTRLTLNEQQLEQKLFEVLQA